MNKIILSELVNKETDIKFNISDSITRLNNAILNFCVAILDNNKNKIDRTLQKSCVHFANCMYNTYRNEKETCTQLIANIFKDAENIMPTLDKKTPNEAAIMIAREIGIVSESETNYTVADRMILVFAAAQKLGYEFDFSWNL